MTRTPKNPADGSPVPVRAAQATPGGAATPLPPRVAAGKTSRTAAPDKRRTGSATPDRNGSGVASQSPAGEGRRRAAGASPAGSNPLAAAMSEAELEKGVRRLIKDLGLLGYHTRDSRGSAHGFFDWVIVGDRVIYRELKTAKGRLTAAQWRWFDALVLAGADADVWRPEALLSGRIARELAALAGLRAGAA